MQKRLPLKTIIKNIFTMPLGTTWNELTYKYEKIDISKFNITKSGQVIKDKINRAR